MGAPRRHSGESGSGSNDIEVINRKTLEIAAAIQGGGVLGGGHQIGTDSNGNLYVALTNRGLQ